ncbi:MAG: protein kinase [Anaerolineae bacterium]
MSTPAPSIRRLGQFQLLRQLGGGDRSLVYQALDTVLPRRVALKVLRQEYARDGQRRAEFLNEARKVAALSHRNVVKVWTVGEEHGLPYVAYEFVEGESLEQRISRVGRLPVAAVLPLLRQAAAALDHCHQVRISHGDVKPANLMVGLGTGTAGEAEQVTLVDFGLARSGADGGPGGGTPEYMAPELFNGSRPSAATDVYALGATAYQLLSGRTPFTGNEFKLARDHGKRPIAAAPGISACAFRAIQRAMAKDPQQRWPSAVAFVEALDCERWPAWLPYAAAGVGLLLVSLGVAQCGGSDAGPRTDGGDLTPPAITNQAPAENTVVVTDTPIGGVGASADGPVEVIAVPIEVTDDGGGAVAVTDTPPPSPTGTSIPTTRRPRPTAPPAPSPAGGGESGGGEDEEPKQKPTKTDPRPTEPRPTDPRPTEPKPTDPRPTDIEPPLPLAVPDLATSPNALPGGPPWPATVPLSRGG